MEKLKKTITLDNLPSDLGLRERDLSVPWLIGLSYVAGRLGGGVTNVDAFAEYNENFYACWLWPPPPHKITWNIYYQKKPLVAWLNILGWSKPITTEYDAIQDIPEEVTSGEIGLFTACLIGEMKLTALPALVCLINAFTLGCGRDVFDWEASSGGGCFCWGLGFLLASSRAMEVSIFPDAVPYLQIIWKTLEVKWWTKIIQGFTGLLGCVCPFPHD